MTKRSLLAGLSIAAVIALGSLCSATDHPRRLHDGAETFHAVPPVMFRGRWTRKPLAYGA